MDFPQLSLVCRYIHKLFDRSVDFAKFNKDASLYSLARAWMKNKPDEVDEDSASDSPSISVRKRNKSLDWS